MTWSTKKLLTISGVVLAILIVIPSLYLLYSKLSPHQFTQTQADVVCQGFYEKVSKDISSVPGYTVLKGNKICRPSTDEAGATDYYFTVSFDVARSGNETIDSLKLNINNLAAKYPNQDYDAWIDNNTAADKISNTICVTAMSQIQEDGSVYQSGKPSHHPRYIEPGEFNTTFRSSCVGS